MCFVPLNLSVLPTLNANEKTITCLKRTVHIVDSRLITAIQKLSHENSN